MSTTFAMSATFWWNHCWQSQQSRLELGLCLSDWFQRANDLDCRRASWWWKAFRCACGWKVDGVCGTRIGDSILRFAFL